MSHPEQQDTPQALPDSRVVDDGNGLGGRGGGQTADLVDDTGRYGNSFHTIAYS